MELQHLSFDQLKQRKLELESFIAKSYNMQLAMKIQLNSAYGALSNQYFRWFDDTLAESITLSGQLSIRWIERSINSFLNKKFGIDKDWVIAADTDSVYLNLEIVAQELDGYDGRTILDALDEYCEKELQKHINESYQDLADKQNAFAQKMKMKREKIADKGIWTAKKRYILNVLDSEGVRYGEPKVEATGIEAVKSSTPAVVKTAIEKAMKLLMSGTEDELIDFIEGFHKKFNELPFEEIAFPRGVNGMTKYEGSTTLYASGTPIHTRGALVYNDLIKKMNLLDQYRLINDGEKIKFCYLKIPNPAKENVISAPDMLPKQLGLDKYIDYELQFQKTFIEPLSAITNAIGWHTERVSDLSDFFGE